MEGSGVDKRVRDINYHGLSYKNIFAGANMSNHGELMEK